MTDQHGAPRELIPLDGHVQPVRQRRCAQVSRDARVSLLGSAAPYNGFALVPAPAPWPHDAGDLDALRGVAERWRELGIRAQLVTGPNDTGATMMFTRPDGKFRGYLAEPANERVVLVCTHGRRDVCCGGDGTRTATQLEAHPPRSARVLRTSHLGGHRFAPTALILPEGTMWGYLDGKALTAIVDRTMPVEQALDHYRGCTGLDSPEFQVADAGALMLHGWRWLDEPREGELVSRSGDTTEVILRSTRQSYRAIVAISRHVPSPKCGLPVDENTPMSAAYKLHAIGPLRVPGR